ncbi:ABC transporter permease [Paenibacillus abyssi]|uniref:Sugar ABC transporter permease n=1 Tax=Paenibacillus abyssi TaxID=1340531 RepID=A0A917G5M3_9BACL|nr:ribose ABC transporter permease [Paenibacillus abyssi]GGG22959.1 sugar ABC transporter permease [Paenibacillus abyssi]
MSSLSLSLKKDTGKYLAKYGIYIAFGILLIVLSVSSESFLTVTNLLNILRQASISGIIAIGMTFVIIRGGIDLSVGSILAFSAVVASSFAHSDMYPTIVPITLGLIAGLVLGCINGIIISRWKVASFIVTLGMMTAARGLTLVYTDGRPIINLNAGYGFIGGGYIAGIPVPVLIFVGVILLGFFALHVTKFGRHVFASGGNEKAAKLSGVKVGRVEVAVYAISGLAAGLAGILLSSRVMTGSPVLGTGYELDAIAAVVIGGTSLAGGRGRIVGTVVGVLIIGIMNNGLDLLNVSSYYQQIIKGAIIVLAVLLDKKNQ